MLMSISTFSRPKYKKFLKEKGRGDFKGRRGRKEGKSDDCFSPFIVKISFFWFSLSSFPRSTRFFVVSHVYVNLVQRAFRQSGEQHKVKKARKRRREGLGRADRLGPLSFSLVFIFSCLFFLPVAPHYLNNFRIGNFYVRQDGLGFCSLCHIFSSILVRQIHEALIIDGRS